MSVVFPTDVKAAAAAAKGATIRAGATELTERRHQGLSSGPLVDLRDVAALRGIAWDGTSARIGAMTPMAEIAADAGVMARYPGLAAASGALATPQIRAVGTIGGNLLQRSRCWYFRSLDAQPCLKRGGSSCLARGGDHLFHACFDVGPCAAVHPSTLALTLLAYEAHVKVHGGASMTMADLLGDGSDPRVENRLPSGALLETIEMPAPAEGERAAYFRAISRARSEWPLVEAIARLVVDGSGRITLARVAIGGVAAVPLRRRETEAALEGKMLSGDLLAEAAALASSGAKPLPMTGYKVGLIEGTVLETLERASHGSPVHLPATPTPAPPSTEPPAPASTETPAPAQTPASTETP